MTSRRHFLRTAATSLAASASSPVSLGAGANRNSNLRIMQIGAGGIGQLDRRELLTHPKVEFTGFVDVNGEWLDKYSEPFPHAFRERDYREAFARHGEKFDAVVIDTPDFQHALMILTALKHGKHVYAQKPLVQQLDELRLVKEALPGRPDLITQMGTQRATNEGRLKAIEFLRQDRLGKPLEAHVWTGKMQRDSCMPTPWSALPKAEPIPGHMDWDLWNGPLLTRLPYSAEIVPRRWRGWWETGTGMLGDWGCHLIDVLFYAYDLASPESVVTHTARPAGHAHSADNRSTITFPGGERFAREKFVLHYNDGALRPDFTKLGLPSIKPYFNRTLVICEGGALLLGDLGEMWIFRDGKQVQEPLPEVQSTSHWHDWVDACLGTKPSHRTPFPMALRITEPSLLAVKATRFPGTNLNWDSSSYRFTNSEQANHTILKRQYRPGFNPMDL